MSYMKRHTYNELLKFIRENLNNFENDRNWLKGQVLRELTMAVYKRQSSADRQFLRDYVKTSRTQILNDAHSNRDLQHTISRGAGKVTKVIEILANNPDIDFESFNRSEAKKIAKLIYNVENPNDRKIGYIRTLVMNNYDRIEADLQVEIFFSPRDYFFIVLIFILTLTAYKQDRSTGA